MGGSYFQRLLGVRYAWVKLFGQRDPPTVAQLSCEGAINITIFLLVPSLVCRGLFPQDEESHLLRQPRVCMRYQFGCCFRAVTVYDSEVTYTVVIHTEGRPMCFASVYLHCFIGVHAILRFSREQGELRVVAEQVCIHLNGRYMVGVAAVAIQRSISVRHAVVRLTG